MKKFSKKGVLLFAAAMALCAFAMPATASAASWGAVGLETTLDSPDVGFTSTTGAVGRIISSCTSSSFTADVRSAAVLTITTGRFGGLCTANLPDAGGATCTTTAVGTRFPWTATVPTTNNVQIHGVFIDVRFEHTPAPNPQNCPLVGADLTITGTLGSGRFANREIIYSNAEGLVSHSALGNGTPITARGTFSSTQNLTVTG